MGRGEVDTGLLPALYPQITRVIFIFKSGKFFADLTGTQGGRALYPSPRY